MGNDDEARGSDDEDLDGDKQDEYDNKDVYNVHSLAYCTEQTVSLDLYRC